MENLNSALLSFCSTEADEILNNLVRKPTIGFINPPFGGKNNKNNPTEKEIGSLGAQ